MNTIDAINSRRAIKHYDPDHQMTAQEVDQLFQLARRSPTAFNIQNYRFVAVQDKALRAEIRKAAWDQAQVTDASLLIILCADLKAGEKNPRRYWKNAPEEVQNFMEGAIMNYYQGKPQVERDEAMRSCGMAAQTIMLAAKAIGYDTCPMDGFDFDKVGELINLPEDHAISMFVVVGKGIKEARGSGGDLPMDEVVIKDKFL